MTSVIDLVVEERLERAEARDVVDQLLDEALALQPVDGDPVLGRDPLDSASIRPGPPPAGRRSSVSKAPMTSVWRMTLTSWIISSRAMLRGAAACDHDRNQRRRRGRRRGERDPPAASTALVPIAIATPPPPRNVARDEMIHDARVILQTEVIGAFDTLIDAPPAEIRSRIEALFERVTTKHGIAVNRWSASA